MQPSISSLGYYTLAGYEYASGKHLGARQKREINKINSFDSHVLIIDDILDDSEKRNGKICIHRKDLGRAISKAQAHRISAYSALTNLATSLSTNPEYSLEAIKKLVSLENSINEGQNIDKLNAGKKISIKQYMKMITLFTGGHVKFGLEIGQLLANKKPVKEVSLIGESAGRIRQIIDDYNDYFSAHHEPFGDFLKEKGRLPEILYDKKRKREVLRYIEARQNQKARSIVLSSKVKQKMFNICNDELKIIRSLNSDFDYEKITPDFSFLAKD